MVVNDSMMERRTVGQTGSKAKGQSAGRSGGDLSLSESLPHRTLHRLPTRLFWV